MAQQASFAGAAGMGDDQERLLDEATAVVREQAFYMKKAIDNDQVRDALKHASNLICELRTSQLSPKNYYELYMQVFQEMQHLSNFFGDRSRHNKRMIDLYESVQHAGNILPRLYLLATVAASYIKSKEAPAKEILSDVSELSKGVQHPLRGLFLRCYLTQMLKDKLPDAGSEYAGEGGDVDDAFEFLFTNFNESNRLWVRIQSQSAAKDRQRRERERHDLRMLVGANLACLSQLEGMTVEYYAGTALPRLLEHIVSVKDVISQQYLLESMVQAFPDEFHIRTLEQLLAAYAKALPQVDMKPIMVTLMDRLARYMQEGDGRGALGDMDLFSLFRSHLQQILERSLEPGATGVPAPAAAPDPAAPLELQAAFLQFTLSLYPGRLAYVDIILESTVQLLRKHAARAGDAGAARLGGVAAERVVELLASPLRTLSLSVLQLEHYPALLGFLDLETRRQVALSMVAAVTEADLPLESAEAVNSLFTFITPLVKDEEDAPPQGAAAREPEAFAREQQQVCRLVHQVRHEDTDVVHQMLKAMLLFFGQGGPERLVFTLPPVCCAALGLVPRIRERERRRAEEGTGAAPAVTVKKVFQFVHKANSELAHSAPEAALQLWLMAAASADQAERAAGAQGAFEPICYEFLTQALIVFEEEISETSKQYQAIFKFVGILTQIGCLEAENFDTAGTKVTQHAARLLKKHLQCRAVANCSHLFWCEARRDGRRVLECLQKCLKLADAVVTSDAKHVGLWVEMLDHYVYYYECQCEEVTVKFVQSLLNLCFEHITFAENDAQSREEGLRARQHLRGSITHLRSLKASSEPEVAARFAELSLEAPQAP